MNATSAVNGSGASLSSSLGFDAGVTQMSAESLLAYCQMQLGDLDTQVNDQMTAQKTALHQREAVQFAQTELNRFNPAGPQTPPDMQTCVDKINTAIAQLPQNDPTAATLVKFRDDMCSQYGFQPPGTLTGDQQRDLLSAQAQDAACLGQTGHHLAGAQATISNLEHLRQTGALNKPPSKDEKQWQGTTDALTVVANDIKSSADIEMLKLQDLVSQRQQAIQLCTGMMSKTDQTLEDQAKAIGR